jgi:hypothetical protein
MSVLAECRNKKDNNLLGSPDWYKCCKASKEQVLRICSIYRY